MKNPCYLPLLDVYRSGCIDNRFYALAYLYDKNGLVCDFGSKAYESLFGSTLTDFSVKFYLRSLFKPIQASVLGDEIIDKFGFSESELAVMQGSHTGEPLHTELVQSILNKIGLNEEALLCPLIEPLNTKIYGRDAKFSRLHNNCSGKHSMMLVYSRAYNLDISNYTDYNHPVQIKIREKLLNYAQTDDYISTSDGCTVPVYGLKMPDIARAFLNYYSDSKNSRLIKSYKNNPYVIGGADNSGKRTDTKISELSLNLVSKVGAGGFIYVYNFKTKQILIVKMAQNNNEVREILTLELLYRLKWLDERFYDSKIYTEAGDAIGEYVFNLN